MLTLQIRLHISFCEPDGYVKVSYYNHHSRYPKLFKAELIRNTFTTSIQTMDYTYVIEGRKDSFVSRVNDAHVRPLLTTGNCIPFNTAPTTLTMTPSTVWVTIEEWSSFDIGTSANISYLNDAD